MRYLGIQEKRGLYYGQLLYNPRLLMSSVSKKVAGRGSRQCQGYHLHPTAKKKKDAKTLSLSNGTIKYISLEYLVSRLA